MARLGEGVTVEQARSELRGIAKALERERPVVNRGRGADVKPLLAWLTPPGVVVGLQLLLAAGLFVQLIACANVGLLGATWGIRQLMGNTPIQPPFWVRLDLDGRALAFVVAVAGMSALVVGLMPALQAGHLNVVDGLKEGSRSVAGRRASDTGCGRRELGSRPPREPRRSPWWRCARSDGLLCPHRSAFTEALVFEVFEGDALTRLREGGNLIPTFSIPRVSLSAAPLSPGDGSTGDNESGGVR